MTKPTFKTFNISMEMLGQACSNVLGEQLFTAIKGVGGGGLTTVHRMAIIKAFVYNKGDADDHYVLKAAQTVLDAHGWYETGAAK